MPIDPNIALGIQTGSPFQTVASMLNVQNGLQQNRLLQAQTQAANIANQANAANLGERNALRNLITDPRVLDASGNVDPSKYAVVAPQVAPTLGGDVSKSITGAQTAAVTNAETAFKLKGAQADRGFQEAAALFQDPRIQGLTDQASPGQVNAAASAILEAQDRATAAGVPRETMAVLTAPFLNVLHNNPAMLPQALKNVVVAGAQRSQQPTVMGPQYSPISTQGGTQLVQTNAFAPGGVGNAGNPYPPPNQIIPSPGGPVITNTSNGQARPLTPAPSTPPMALRIPSGETTQTEQALQDQRTATQSQLADLPARAEVYRNIIDLANKPGLSTGSFAEGVRNLSSRTGYNFFSGNAVDYNALGKYLAQEAARTASAMGPGTNAGLANAQAASGSTSYDPTTIKRIAYLSEANAAALPEYDKGLSAAIQARLQQQPDTDPVFAKRQFDQQWAATYDPRIYELSNAMKRGDGEQVEEIFRGLGVPGTFSNGKFQPSGPMTTAATALFSKAQRLKAMTAGAAQ
ncbi:MAG TPA: hypothetical protein VF453_09530 [Burkholderiaceae bacterium]